MYLQLPKIPPYFSSSGIISVLAIWPSVQLLSIILMGSGRECLVSFKNFCWRCIWCYHVDMLYFLCCIFLSKPGGIRLLCPVSVNISLNPSWSYRVGIATHLSVAWLVPSSWCSDGSKITLYFIRHYDLWRKGSTTWHLKEKDVKYL